MTVSDDAPMFSIVYEKERWAMVRLPWGDRPKGYHDMWFPKELAYRIAHLPSLEIALERIGSPDHLSANAQFQIARNAMRIIGMPPTSITDRIGIMQQVADNLVEENGDWLKEMNDR